MGAARTGLAPGMSNIGRFQKPPSPLPRSGDRPCSDSIRLVAWWVSSKAWGNCEAWCCYGPGAGLIDTSDVPRPARPSMAMQITTSNSCCCCSHPHAAQLPVDLAKYALSLSLSLSEAEHFIFTSFSLGHLIVIHLSATATPRVSSRVVRVSPLLRVLAGCFKSD